MKDFDTPVSAAYLWSLKRKLDKFAEALRFDFECSGNTLFNAGPYGEDEFTHTTGYCENCSLYELQSMVDAMTVEPLLPEPDAFPDDTTGAK